MYLLKFSVVDILNIVIDIMLYIQLVMLQKLLSKCVKG